MSGLSGIAGIYQCYGMEVWIAILSHKITGPNSEFE